jgi:putative transposase
MAADDIIQPLNIACNRIGLVKPIQVKHRPWLLSDNGSAFIFHDQRDYLEGHHIDHVRGAVHHSQHRAKSSVGTVP